MANASLQATLSFESRQPTVHALVLFGVSVAVYAYTLGHPLLWDSRSWTIDDPSVHSLGNIPRFVVEGSTPAPDVQGGRVTQIVYYRPLVKVLYAMEYAAFGTNPGGYHLVNVLLNGLAVVVLFHLLTNWTGDSRLAFAASLLWAVNPVRGEAVTWVFGASELLMALAVLGALSFYRQGRHAAALALFATGLLARENTVLFPLLLLLHEILVPAARTRRRFALLVPYAGIAVIYLLLRAAVTGGMPALSNLPLLTLARTAAVVTARYLKILVLPDAPVAQYPLRIPPSLSGEVLVSWGVIILAAAVLVYLVRTDRRLAFWYAWGFVWLAMTLNVGLFGQYLMMEKWMYLPSAGFCVVAAAFLTRLRLAPVLIGVLALAHGGITVARTTFWRHPVVFYEQLSDFAPDFFLARYMAALEHAGRGDFARASVHLERAVEIIPDHAWALNNLGNCHYMLGDRDRAGSYWQRALAADPGNVTAAYNLGLLAEQAGDRAAALRYYRHYLELVPEPPSSIREKIEALQLPAKEAPSP